MAYHGEIFQHGSPLGRDYTRSPTRPFQQPYRSIRRPMRSSHDRRTSEAKRLFLDDETAKPILRSPYEELNPASKALYYGTLKNEHFNTLYSPDRAEILARQDELDRHERQYWGGIAHRLNPCSYRAGEWLSQNSLNFPRVQRHGRKLRLLERNQILDRLTMSERVELVKWWVSKFGPVETPPTSPQVGKQNLFARTLAHVRGTKYWRARQAKRMRQERQLEREANMTQTQRMDREIYGGNPTESLTYLSARTASGARILNYCD